MTIAGPPTVHLPTPIDNQVKVFRPPYEEFEMQLIDVPSGTSVSPRPNPGPVLLLVQRGCGTIEVTSTASNAAPAGPTEAGGPVPADDDDASGGFPAGGSEGASNAAAGDQGVQKQLQVQKGSVVFVMAGQHIRVTAAGDDGCCGGGDQQQERDGSMRVWVAACNAALFSD
jgi:hypothetical protein